MKDIEVREYGSVEVDVSHEQAAALAAAAGPGLNVRIAPGGAVEITANSRVGTIVTSDLQVRIRPKVPVTNVLYLLTASWQRDWLRSEETSHEEDDLTAAFVALFANAVTHLLRRGPQAAYREMDEELDTIRGRVDLVAQFRRPGLLVPVTCRFTEFTVDTQPNRYIKHAVRQALRVPGVWQRTRSQFRHALASLEGVGHRPPPADLPSRMHFTRLNRAYEPVLRLAALLRRRAGIRDVRGDVAGASFLLDMNDVFERFVEDGMRSALGGRLQVDGQHTDHLDHEGNVQIRPDLLFRAADGTPIYVGDAKYKITSSGVGRASDYYQLHAYCSRYGLAEGVLIYATVDDGAPLPRSVTAIGSGTRLRTLRLSLVGAPSAIEHRIGQIAEDVLERGRRALRPDLSVAG